MDAVTEKLEIGRNPTNRDLANHERGLSSLLFSVNAREEEEAWS